MISLTVDGCHSAKRQNLSANSRILSTEAGFDWGGDWTTRKDYQHFEVIE
jgi:hypothetical protein